MGRKPRGQKKKPSTPNTQSPQLPQQKKGWTRGDLLAGLGIFIAVAGLLLSLTIPEVRQLVGLDHLASKPALYPHLWKYYSGDQQIEEGKDTLLNLTISWQTPVAGPKGIFEGHITFAAHNGDCSISGSLDLPNSNSYASIQFTCTSAQNSARQFNGDVYPDTHISGTVTNPTSVWHFYMAKTVNNAPDAQNCGPLVGTCESSPGQGWAPICSSGRCPNAFPNSSSTTKL